MSLNDIPSNSTVFIDSPIFIYHFTDKSPECSEFLNRCAKGYFQGVTSVIVLIEVLHRLMTLEAVQKGLVSPGNIVRRLRENSTITGSLSDYYTDTLHIFEISIEVYPFDDGQNLLEESQFIRIDYGFLTNDSLNATFMKLNEVTNIATNDNDFDRMPSIQVCKPTDV